MSKISVIVPVYKVEKYIHKCVDSILAQTFSDFELILVDDGSPDNCGKICDEYSEKDDRVVVLHKENGGLSDARNAGLDWVFEHSDSGWITFIDSDDWLRPTYLEALLNAADGKKLSICGFQRADVSNHFDYYKEYGLQTDTPENLYCNNSINFVVAWGKLYPRECFINIRYPKGKIHEDEYVTYLILFKFSNIAIVDEPLYIYLKNVDGICRSGWVPQKMDVFPAIEAQIQFFRDNGFKKAYVRSIQKYANTVCNNIFYADINENNKKHISNMRALLRQHLKKYHNEQGIKHNLQYYSYAYPIMTKFIRIAGFSKRILKRLIYPKSERIGLLGKIYFYHNIKKNLKQFKQTPDIDDFPVDFVVSWVNGNDPEWIQEKREYEIALDNDKKTANPTARYRDWNMFHYWFRAVEKNAPWVRNVYLLTWGHVPEWLETSHPKLKIIRHSEFIPAEYLPTFSSHTIELNMWRIEELSEHFVYFNDDMLLTAPVKKSDFFTKGLPKYCPLTRPKYTFNDMTVFEYVLMNNTGLFNSDIDFREIIKKHPEKWIYPFNSTISKYNMRTFKDGYLSGMRFTHVCMPYRKSSMIKCAERFSKKINETSRNKFRTYRDVNHQIFQIWEMVNAGYIPVGEYYYGRLVNVNKDSMAILREYVLSGQNKCVCINDNDFLTDRTFELMKPKVLDLLEEKYPDKSSFEK